mmetsp:Transcript_89685/g.252864  ORF Transcript_89685/g.252864 Transcript_89685/m.252864 type:complete len:254 (-) Transcript_89685:515-1276(-)
MRTLYAPASRNAMHIVRRGPSAQCKSVQKPVVSHGCSASTVPPTLSPTVPPAVPPVVPLALSLAVLPSSPPLLSPTTTAAPLPGAQRRKKARWPPNRNKPMEPSKRRPKVAAGSKWMYVPSMARGDSRTFRSRRTAPVSGLKVTLLRPPPSKSTTARLRLSALARTSTSTYTPMSGRHASKSVRRRHLQYATSSACATFVIIPPWKGGLKFGACVWNISKRLFKPQRPGAGRGRTFRSASKATKPPATSSSMP